MIQSASAVGYARVELERQALIITEESRNGRPSLPRKSTVTIRLLSQEDVGFPGRDTKVLKGVRRVILVLVFIMNSDMAFFYYALSGNGPNV